MSFSKERMIRSLRRRADMERYIATGEMSPELRRETEKQMVNFERDIAALSELASKEDFND